MSRPRYRDRFTRAASRLFGRTRLGAAFDNPDLVVTCVVGDGEAETGPLATSWHSNKFLNAKNGRRRPPDSPPERLQVRQPDRAGTNPEEELIELFEGSATARLIMTGGFDARIMRPCTSALPRCSTRRWTRSPISRGPRARTE